MVIEPDQSTDNSVEEGVSLVEEAVSAVDVGVDPKETTPEATTPNRAPKKAAVKRKKPTAKRKRSKKAAEPVVKEVQPLTADEIRATLTDAKTQIVTVGLAPIQTALTSWSETLRDTVSGALGGLLGSKKRSDD